MSLMRGTTCMSKETYQRVFAMSLIRPLPQDVSCIVSRDLGIVYKNIGIVSKDIVKRFVHCETVRALSLETLALPLRTLSLKTL